MKCNDTFFPCKSHGFKSPHPPSVSGFASKNAKAHNLVMQQLESKTPKAIDCSWKLVVIAQQDDQVGSCGNNPPPSESFCYGTSKCVYLLPSMRKQ